MSISFFELFKIADSYPDEPNFLLKFKSAETIEGCPSDFRLRICKFIKGLRPRIGLKVVKPHLHGHGSTLVTLLLHAGNNILSAQGAFSVQRMRKRHPYQYEGFVSSDPF